MADFHAAAAMLLPRDPDGARKLLVAEELGQPFTYSYLRVLSMTDPESAVAAEQLNVRWRRALANHDVGRLEDVLEAEAELLARVRMPSPCKVRDAA